MKRKSAIVLLIVLLFSIVLFSFSGCSSSGFKQEDFQLAITDVQVNGNNVIVNAEFKNTSWRNGMIVSGFSIIEVIYQDEEQSLNWGFPSIAKYYWIRCKQTIKETEEFQLEKGKYTIIAIVDFHCNKDKDRFYYKAETIIEV